MPIRSIEDSSGTYCVDLISHPDNTVTAKQFRRDPEDGGRWTLVADYSSIHYASEHDAIYALLASVSWLADAQRGA
jgi:hypothetical protein